MLNNAGIGRRLGQTDQEALLVVKDLRVDFVSWKRTVHAVRGMSYSLGGGETLGLVGESGSGKSVSALAILGLLPPRTARVDGAAFFRGRDLIGLDEASLRHLRGSQLAMVFQDPLSSLTPVLTIGLQIAEQIEAHERVSRRVAVGRAVELLRTVGIPEPEQRIRAFPHQLSGGMRQRAMIAMALSCNPAVLIADEPTTALDVTIQAQILALMEDMRQRLGMAVLLITHDLGIVAGFVDRVAVMYAGRIVETGPTASVLAAPTHPYTVGLMRSLPRLDGPRREPLTPIEGSPPDLSAVLSGCPFRPRCPLATAQCAVEDPPMMGMAGGRFVACWNASDIPEGNGSEGE